MQHSYHVQIIQALTSSYYVSLLAFTRCSKRQNIQIFRQPLISWLNLSSHMMVHLTSMKNMCGGPSTKYQHAYQQCVSVSVCARIIDDCQIGAYLKEERLGGRKYVIFLLYFISVEGIDVPRNIRQHMGFQYIGAPPHFDWKVGNNLGVLFPGKWIGQGDVVGWSRR